MPQSGLLHTAQRDLFFVHLANRLVWDVPLSCSSSPCVPSLSNIRVTVAVIIIATRVLLQLSDRICTFQFYSQSYLHVIIFHNSYNSCWFFSFMLSSILSLLPLHAFIRTSNLPVIPLHAKLYLSLLSISFALQTCRLPHYLSM